MKKLLSVLIMLVLVVSIFAGCTTDNEGDAGNKGETPPVEDSTDNDEDTDTAEQEYKDGTYTAEEKDFADSGWKDNVTVEIKEGKIASVVWNSTHKDGGVDKITASKNGDYGMVENGGAVAEWHEQAEKAESYLIEKQDPNALAVKDDGLTDAVAGVTMHVDGFVELVEEALAQAK
ncbi:MAG TPA: FMN-binding protein [Clostridia bacterium]|nr:FMN-binding protein [Clostridia bacterium]